MPPAGQPVELALAEREPVALAREREHRLARGRAGGALASSATWSLPALASHRVARRTAPLRRSPAAPPRCG